LEKKQESISRIRQPSIEDSIVNFALVIRGPLRDFTDIKSYVKNMTSSRVVYQKTSLGFLRIVEEVRTNES